MNLGQMCLTCVVLLLCCLISHKRQFVNSYNVMKASKLNLAYWFDFKIIEK